MKYVFEDAVKAFGNKGYELLSSKNDYVNCSTKLKYVCPIHKDKGIQEISLSHLLHNRGCYYCGRKRTEDSRTKELDIEYDRKLAESKGFTYIGSRRDNKEKRIIWIDYICNSHSDFGIQSMKKFNMQRDTCKGCKYCKGDLPESYVKKKMKEINPNLILLDDYVNISTRIKCKCIKHNQIAHKTPQEILRGKGCYYCGLEKLSKINTLSQTQYEEKLFVSNPDIEVVSEYKGMEYDITVKCKKCGYIWTTNAHSLISNGTSCRKCSYHYKGEDIVLKILQKYNINFVQQYRFMDCIDKRPLPFDFYLPTFNVCIEFDGEQHYKPKFGMDSFEKTVLHDRLKNEYCKNNNIKLIRIPYWDSSNTEEILQSELSIK